MNIKSRVNTAKIAGLITALVVLASGVAYAALQSQQVKLTGNTIQTASANLMISSDGTAYSSSQPGFSFTGIVPGGAAVPTGGQKVYLKNTGNAAVALKFFVNSTPTNPDLVDLTKVNVIITPTTGGAAQTITLQSLITSQATGGATLNTPASLAAGATTSYNITVSMATDAITGSSATIGSIDFVFTGLAITN